MWWKSWITPPPPPPWKGVEDVAWLTPTRVVYSCFYINWAIIFIKSFACCKQVTANYRRNIIPSDLKGRMNPLTFLKAKKYEQSRINLQIFKPCYYMFIRSMFMYFEMPWTLILKSESFVDYLILLNLWPSNLNKNIGVFFFTLVLNCCCLQYINLPVECISVFLVDEMHGVSKQSVANFVYQRFKEMATLGEFFLIAFGYVLMKQVDASETLSWIFVVIMAFVFHRVDSLINNKFTPLKEGTLLTRLQVLANYCGFQISEVKVLKISPRSTRVCQDEVYLEGYGSSKKLILPERLLLKCHGVSQLEYNEEIKEIEVTSEDSKYFTLDEVEALAAEELGHWKRHHVWWKLMMDAACGVLSLVVICFYIFKKTTIEHFADNVRQVEKDEDLVMKHVILTMYLFTSEIYGVYHLVTECIWNNFHRTCEYSADSYAAQLGYGKALREALIKISCDNLEFPYCDSLYSFFFNRSPPTVKRIKAIDETLQKNQ